MYRNQLQSKINCTPNATQTKKSKNSTEIELNNIIEVFRESAKRSTKNTSFMLENESTPQQRQHCLR